MRDLHLTPEHLLPAITPDDQLFADMIIEEYDLPPDEITWLIRDVKDSIQDNFSKEMEDSRLNETYQKLFSPGTEIKGISIVTNKGTVDIKPYDSVFDLHFRRPLQRMRLNFKETLNSEIDFLTSLSRKSSFAKIIFYFEGTQLNKMRTNNAIFDFILYFKIGDSVKTEDEWNANPTSDQTFKHYKHKTVMSRKIRYLKDLNK